MFRTDTDMKQFKIGLQLYGVRSEMEKDFEGTLQKVHDMGYEYVEFAGYFGRTGEQIRDILQRIGLKCVSVHQTPDWILSDGQKAVDFLKAFGTEFCIVPWYPADRHYGTDAWQDTVKNFTAAADLLRKNGMKLGYHNHDFEFRTYQGKYLLDYLYETMPQELLEPELDTCWIHYAGVEPCAYIRKYAGRMHVIHLKDFVCTKLGGGPVYALIGKDGEETAKPTQEESGFRFKPLGEGIQDWHAILAAAEDAGITYAIVEQDDTYELPPLEAARISREYLRKEFGL